MNLTEEQEIIIDHILNDTTNLIKVDSCAGSGKTSLLVETVKQLNPKSGLYLAYNKAIALESKKKFSNNIECVTTHSLAYKHTVGNKTLNLHLGNFFWKTIKEKIDYEHKVVVIDLLKEWSLSPFYKFDEFKLYKQDLSPNLHNRIFDLVKKYFNQMISGEIPINHDGYLKLYHILLANDKTNNKEYDLIMLDECGDLNMVTLEIFKLLHSKKKVMVGDVSQNIYTFNHTVNGFDVMRNNGIQLSMSQSFRCDSKIAKKIEKFGHKYISGTKNFKGVEHENKKIETTGYISRNNSELVKKMIELYLLDIKFNTLRPINSIFELVLILINVNNQDSRITKGDYKYLQDDIDEFNSNPLFNLEYGSPYKYLFYLYGEEIAFRTAFALIQEHGIERILSVYNQLIAQEKNKTKYNITLGTVFGTKGLEFDEVYILDDLNRTITKILNIYILGEVEDNIKNENLVEFNLYYTACSRAKYKLHNALHLED